MKTKILLLALSLFFISVGCKKLNPKKELRIDLGTNFNNDLVTIKLDNKVVFSDNVSTHSILGVANVLTYNYPVGKSTISVNVNGVVKTSKFKHQQDRFIYISYDKQTSNIDIIYPAEKYVYD